MTDEEQTEIPVPDQPTPLAYTEMPKHISFGQTLVCPRCKGFRNKRFREVGYFTDPDGHRGKDGNWERCHRCSGWGIIPNIGA